MGKLAEMMRQEKVARKPAITFHDRPPQPRNEIFTSKGFSGFADFLSDEPQEGFDQFAQQKQAKMSHFFSIIQMLLKMMD